MLSAIQTAEICHEANRLFCAAMGDDSQFPWADSPDWQRDSAERGVMAILIGRVPNPEFLHDQWVADKQHDGWTFGDVKDAAKRTHPCIVPYDQLSPMQQTKDALFFAIVNALR